MTYPTKREGSPQTNNPSIRQRLSTAESLSNNEEEARTALEQVLAAAAEGTVTTTDDTTNTRISPSPTLGDSPLVEETDNRTTNSTFPLQDRTDASGTKESVVLRPLQGGRNEEEDDRRWLAAPVATNLQRRTRVGNDFQCSIPEFKGSK